MKILVADDDLLYRLSLQETLPTWGYEVMSASDGVTASRILTEPDAPKLAIIDWMMPGNEHLQVCRAVRALASPQPTYIILLTARGESADIVTGLQEGADDYLVKPFDQDELRARLQVGQRIVELQRRLSDRMRQLEDALTRVKHLQGLLPICCYCKRIRDDQDYWQQVEAYISSHSGAQFSHSICPTCFETHVVPDLENSVGKK